MRRWLLFPGKALTQPLFVLLLVAIVCLILARRGKRGALRAMMAVIVLMWLCSMELTATMLIRALAVPPDAGEPQVIAILSAGSYRRVDLLNPATTSRVVQGVRWWREHPRARVIMTGADVTPTGTSTRTLELMRALAVQLGVPPANVSIDTWSTRTIEHPEGLLRLGIPPKTAVGIVTNDWHMRRARMVFRRRFERVIVHPARTELDPFVINDVLPSGDGASDTVIMLHECIGIAWYALKR
ncbi:MAG TPA: ElyC/SanA/YdcF family protein [Thermoanaerobaculia bacterium]|nr:ElyC/SanA/YdcF family protein [Thermoanaerobaculia bacterium]